MADKVNMTQALSRYLKIPPEACALGYSYEPPKVTELNLWLKSMSIEEKTELASQAARLMGCELEVSKPAPATAPAA